MSATVSAKLCQAIQNAEWPETGICGLLVGPSQGQLEVSALWRTEAIGTNCLELTVEDCRTYFPCGHRVTGLILVVSAKTSASLKTSHVESSTEEVESVCGPYNEVLEHMGSDSCLLLCIHQTDDKLVEIGGLLLGKDGLKPVSISQEWEMERHSVALRLKAALPILVSTESKEGISNQLEMESTRFQTMLHNGSFVYGIDNNQILLTRTGSVQNSSIPKPKTCKDLQAHIQRQEEERGGGGAGTSRGGSKKKATLKPPPISMTLLEMASCVSSSQSYAPVIAHQVGIFQSVAMSLPLDILIDVSEDLPLNKLSTLITESVSSQLTSFFKCLRCYAKKDQFHSPEVFHFQVVSLDSPVTVVYPRGISEQELEKERLALHRKLCLPQDRPYLRRSSGNIFLNPTAPGGYLLNTHIGLPDPPVKSGTVSVVPGFYSYHHYMQDHFNDDKWGCAYRSLQTIISWFKYQGYTDANIPSHKEIQQALHDVGDKPEKFVGSRQWIGSFEVSFVLDHLLGVTSKFINVNAGTELSSTGQQLAHHFQEEGTPVMIGGGVLAHTILGVAYDELTGDISFLILDPHYTGGEDLRTVQSKGWCGWKDMKFWNQTAHYNLCLPQRPQMV